MDVVCVIILCKNPHETMFSTEIGGLHFPKMQHLWLNTSSQERCAVTDVIVTRSKLAQVPEGAGRAKCWETGNLSWKRVLNQTVYLELKHEQKAQIKTWWKGINGLLLAEREAIQEIKGQSMYCTVGSVQSSRQKSHSEKYLFRKSKPLLRFSLRSLFK